jgi:hypothetical protein
MVCATHQTRHKISNILYRATQKSSKATHGRLGGKDAEIQIKIHLPAEIIGTEKMQREVVSPLFLLLQGNDIPLSGSTESTEGDVGTPRSEEVVAEAMPSSANWRML